MAIRLSTLDLEKEKVYTYAEELTIIVNKINEVISKVNSEGATPEEIDELYRYVEEIAGTVSDLSIAVDNLEDLFSGGKAKKSLEALKLKYESGAIDTELSFDVLNERWSSDDDISAPNIRALATAIENLNTTVGNIQQLFDNGKAKKALEALKLKYEGATDSEIVFDALNDEWKISGNTSQLYARFIHSININDMDDAIIALKSYFSVTGEALEAQHALEADYAEALSYSSTRYIVYDTVNGEWHVGGDINAQASDIKCSELIASIVTIQDLDTSDPHVAGQLWNDSGTVKISNG